MKAFRVSGKFKMGHAMMQFTNEYALADRRLVEDKVLSEFGSKHGVNRRNIKIEKVEEIGLDQVQDASVRQMLGGK
jgi:large subunit ribosomal protein LX